MSVYRNPSGRWFRWEDLSPESNEDMQETTFAAWKKEVDAVLRRKTGMPSSALPDVDYWGLYVTGNTPEEAADFAYQNAKEC